MKFKYIDPFDPNEEIREASEDQVYSMVANYVKEQLQIPDNWDKHDYESKHFSANTIISVVYNFLENMVNIANYIDYANSQNSELNWGGKWSL